MRNNMLHSNMLHTNGLLFFASMLMMMLMPVTMPDPIRSFTVAAISAARRKLCDGTYFCCNKINMAATVAATVAAKMATATPRWRMHQDGWRRSRTASSASFLCVADCYAALCCDAAALNAMLCLKWMDAIAHAMCAVRQQDKARAQYN